MLNTLSDRKYILLEPVAIEGTNEDGDVIENEGYPIQAIRDFGDVKKDDIGGYVLNEDNLSHEGDCWIYDSSIVSDNARVRGNAKIKENCIVTGYAQIFGDAVLTGDVDVSGNACIYDNAFISDAVQINDNARVFGNAKVQDSSII
ncbi:hypothetical protein K9692_004877, partial [Escherichia coli]|nr:hypothetical protein [Escherichia coli]